MQVRLLRPVDVVADTAAPLLERESSLALLNEIAARARALSAPRAHGGDES